MLRSAFLLGFIISTTAFSSRSQTSILDVGLRFQKTVNLYYENGIALSYSNKNLKPDKLYFGFSYVSSRLGTAMHSNAIKQDNYLFSSAYLFRKSHLLRPFVTANVGFFYAHYGDPVFDVLPQKSALFSTETGLSFKSKLPLKLATSLGYNFITGDGVEGPGTLYPVFYQATLSWDILNKRK